MDKLFLIVLFPFALGAQVTSENRNQGTKDSLSQINVLRAEPIEMNAYERIESYRQRVMKGEDMSTLARLYSEDPGSAKKGGIYLNLARGVFVPEFEAVAFRLSPGEISEVFKTQYGYHFIQLLDRHGETVDLRHILVSFK